MTGAPSSEPRRQDARSLAVGPADGPGKPGNRQSRASTPQPPTGGLWPALTAAVLAEYSPATAACYGRAASQFAAWAEEQCLDPVQADRHDVQCWVASLVARGLAGSSVSQRVSGLGAVLRLAHERGLRADADPTPRVRRPPRDRRVNRAGLTRQEVSALLRTAAEQDARLYAYLCLLTICALRPAEALNARVEHLAERHGGRVLDVSGKGGRAAFVTVPPVVASVVDGVVDGRRDGPVLVTATGRAWHPRPAARALRRLAVEVGIAPERAFPYALRSAHVDLSLEAGCPLERVAESCRHVDIRTTALYRRQASGPPVALVVAELLLGDCPDVASSATPAAQSSRTRRLASS